MVEACFTVVTIYNDEEKLIWECAGILTSPPPTSINSYVASSRSHERKSQNFPYEYNGTHPKIPISGEVRWEKKRSDDIVARDEDLTGYTSSELIAVGSHNAIKILDKSGTVLNEIKLDSSSRMTNPCLFEFKPKQLINNRSFLAAVSRQRSTKVHVWQGSSNTVDIIDTGFKDDATVLTWNSPTEGDDKCCIYLAIATNRGNLMILDLQTRQKLNVVGKHNKRITCGAWSRSNKSAHIESPFLALASEDKTLSISNVDGDNIRIAHMRSPHLNLLKVFGLLVALVVNECVLYALDLDKKDTRPSEMTFNESYGHIINYDWTKATADDAVADEKIMFIAFSNSIIVGISFKDGVDTKSELFQIDLTCPAPSPAMSITDPHTQSNDRLLLDTVFDVRIYKKNKQSNSEETKSGESLNDFLIHVGCIHGSSSVTTPADGNIVRFIEMKVDQTVIDSSSNGDVESSRYKVEVVTEKTIEVTSSQAIDKLTGKAITEGRTARATSSTNKGGSATSIDLSDGGQYLSVLTSSGDLQVHVCNLPSLSSFCFSPLRNKLYYSYLSNVEQITVQCIEEDSTCQSYTITCKVEPCILITGSSIICYGRNRQLWFHSHNHFDETVAEINETGHNDGHTVENTDGYINMIEYPSHVEDVKVNDKLYCSTLYAGQIKLHKVTAVDSGSLDEQSCLSTKDFNFSGQSSFIQCQALNDEYLVFASNSGFITYFSIGDWMVLSETQLYNIKTINLQASNILAIVEVDTTFVIYNPIRPDGIEFQDVVQIQTGLPLSKNSSRKTHWNISAGRERENMDLFVIVDMDSMHVEVWCICLGSIKSDQCFDLRLIETFAQSDVLEYDIRSIIAFVNGQLVCENGQKYTIKRLTTPFFRYLGELSNQVIETGVDNINIFSKEVEHSNEREQQRTYQTIEKCVALRFFEDGWRICRNLSPASSQSAFAHLAETILTTYLDVMQVMPIYRHLNMVDKVWQLQDVMWIEEKNLLAGHVHKILGRYDEAQSLFLKSECREEAVNMRYELGEFEEALYLSRQIFSAKNMIPNVLKEYAKVCEMKGEYQKALSLYKEAHVVVEESGKVLEQSCLIGEAKMLLKCGDIKQGLEICKQIDSPSLWKESAEIMEKQSYFKESAEIFKRQGFFDKSAFVYLKIEDWVSLEEILDDVTSPKIQDMYAEHFETSGEFDKAVKAYTMTMNVEKLIKIYIENLSQPHKAIQLVQKTGSKSGAALIANFFIGILDFASAIEFLIMSECVEKAFEIAVQHTKMKTFVKYFMRNEENKINKTKVNKGDELYIRIAQHFESTNENFYEAGVLYEICDEPLKAVNNFMKDVTRFHTDKKVDVMAANGENDGASYSSSMKRMMHVVTSLNDVQLSKKLLSFLLGDSDGVPKDATYIFQFYMLKNQYVEAAKVAIIISENDKKNGDFKKAHNLLFRMTQELDRKRLVTGKTSSTIKQNLMTVHSYLLARHLIRQSEHWLAAQMLLRMCHTLNSDAAHYTNILTSAILECQKANLVGESIELATRLMKLPSSRTKHEISDKYRRKFEYLIRHRIKLMKNQNDEEKRCSPCPFCDEPVNICDLACNKCSKDLPYCILNGCHIVRDDLSKCHACRFPMTLSLVVRYKDCPMCGISFEGVNSRFEQCHYSDVDEWIHQ